VQAIIIDAVTDADAIVLVTEWNQDRGLDLDRVRAIMKDNVFVGLRNDCERDLMQEYGFNYTCVVR